jgi:hypothetical protein
LSLEKRKYISVVGPAAATCTKPVYELGLELGLCLANKGFGIVCGGGGGLMEAVCKGSKSASGTFEGSTIGILPGEHAHEANPYCDIVIPTGLGIARNILVVRSGLAVIAVGGGSGTLSEIAFAWQLGKPICAMSNVEGWSKELAGKQLDQRHEGSIFEAKSLEDALSWLDQLF